jgi:hypothetical protein
MRGNRGGADEEAGDARRRGGERWQSGGRGFPAQPQQLLPVDHAHDQDALFGGAYVAAIERQEPGLQEPGAPDPQLCYTRWRIRGTGAH